MPLSPQAPSRRNLAIDTLRGLACVMLVAYHVVGGDKSTGLKLPDEHLLRTVNDVLSCLRMPLFAFLSGVVYAARPPSKLPGRIIKGKVRRLLVPLLLVGTLVALLQSRASGVNAAPINWALLHIMPVAHFWFLESLFLIFTLVALLDWRGALATEARTAAVGAAALVLFATNPLPYYFGLQGAALLLPSFMLGLWAKRFGYRYSASALKLVAGLMAALALAAIAIEGHGWPDGDRLESLALGASGCIVLFWTAPQSAWLARIGHYSFSIYLFHTTFAAAMRMALAPMGTPLPLMVGLGLTAGLLGPIVLERALKRMPPVGYWFIGQRPPSPPKRWPQTGATI